MIKLKAFVKADRSTTEEPDAKWLEIEQHVVKRAGCGFYLFYYNDNGELYADDYGLTLEEAIYNAYCHCGVKPEDWRIVKSED